MNEMVLLRYDLEQIMRRAIGAGLLVFGIVFLAGVLFGWGYSLFIGFIIAFLVMIIGMRK